MNRPARGGGLPARNSGPLRLPHGPAGRTGRRLLLILAAVALGIAAAGCGGGNAGGSSTAGATAGGATTGTTATSTTATTLRIQADPSGALRFSKSALAAPAGKVTIVMANPSPLSHDVAIEGNGVKVTGAIVPKGGTSTVTVNLKPGSYTFLCTVDGHAAAGMKGTLTVG